MTQRKLYLAAYDIACPRRLRRALDVLRDYATGGQKSVFECHLADGERRELLQRVKDLLDIDEDRFLLLRLDRRSKIRTLGIATPPRDGRFFYLE